MNDMLRHLAKQLFEARRDARAIPLDERFRSLDIAEAYAVQDHLADLTIRSGAKVVGWKIGLTSPGAMAAFGATEPMAGRLFERTLLPSAAVINLAETCDARVEGEILIEVGHVPVPPFDDRELLSAIASVRPAIEIADSRFSGWPKDVAPVIADDASCGWVVAGEGREAAGLDLASIEMRFTSDDIEVGRGTGANCLGCPLTVLRWFFDKARELEWEVKAGHLILTGAMAPPTPAGSGVRHQATLTGLGQVSFRLSENDLVRR